MTSDGNDEVGSIKNDDPATSPRGGKLWYDLNVISFHNTETLGLTSFKNT